MKPEQGYQEWAASDDFVNTVPQAFYAGVEWARKHPAGNPAKTWEGCRACFGSGGKRIDPCLVCGGTGKVAKSSQSHGQLNQTGVLR